MKEQFVILYTMKGCPFCVMMKEQLNNLNIEFVERDIDEQEEEFDMFGKAVGGNDAVPAFMIIETDGKNHKSHFYVPEKHFIEVDEGVKIIEEHFKRFNL